MMATTTTGPATSRTLRSVVLAVLALSFLVASCGGGQDAETATGQPGSTTTPETTAGPDSEATSTGEPTGQGITLRGDGLGIVSFGQPADEVLAILERVIGSPPSDQGAEADWIEFVGWSELGLYVGFDTPMSSEFTGESRLLGWDAFGPVGGPRPTTAEGVGVGSTLAELRAAYGDRLDVATEPDECAGDWVVQIRTAGGDIGIIGVLDREPADEALVSMLHAGIGVGC
jgi:hypothetical protein